MFLIKGITGFYHVRRGKPQNVDMSFFKKACYIMDSAGFSVITVYCPEIASYYEAQIAVGDELVSMLMNKYYPVIGFCKNGSDGKKIFIDLPGENLSEFGYKVTSAAELNAEFNNFDHDLDAAELEQIKYWKPQSVGEIVFNEWD